jgi:endonuclease YncB( thermonuclease family)
MQVIARERWRIFEALAMAVILGGPLVSPVEAQSFDGAIISGRAKARDGDSVLIGQGKGTVDARLHGIDAPEWDQQCKDKQGEPWPCGQVAKKALAGLVDGRELRCQVTDVEKWGGRRPIVRCFEGSINISAEMLQRGMAWAFDRYLEKFEDHSSLKEMESRAKSDSIGIWQGEAEPPWQFRERRWERYAARAPKGCPIIGNPKSRVYHTPWSRQYSRMFELLIASPDAKGKRWFCDEGEAFAAGFRPAR